MEPGEYARLAEVEDRLWYLRSLRARVVDSLAGVELAHGTAVLDAGCGTGGTLKRLKAWRPDLRLHAVDFSPLACAHTRKAGFEVEEASVEDLPFPDAAFGAIVGADVLPQIESPLLALVEFHRCLAPGGWLFVNAAALPWLWSYHDEHVLSVQRFHGRELRRLVREAGFAIEFSTHWNFLLLPLAILRRKVFPRRDGASDVRPSWPPLNAALGGVAACERLAGRARVPLPIGSSFQILARKPVRTPRVRLE